MGVSPSLFAEQMQWLASNAKVVRLADVVSALRKAYGLPPRSIVLTFDDALLDFYDTAAPVLRRLNLPATVFVPTGYCGKTDEWNGNSAREKLPLMSWKQLHEMAHQGFDLGAHSVTHRVLTDISSFEAGREIIESKAQLHSELRTSVDFFCYPFGRWNPQIREVVKAHYQGACSTHTGALRTTSDAFALPRVDCHFLRNPQLFKLLLKPQLNIYLGLRRALRKIRGYGEAA